MPSAIKEKDLSLVIPLTPPSVNSYVRHTRKGRHYVSAEALKFKEAIAIFARGRSVDGKFYQVDINVFYAKGERGDLDNRTKCVLDGLEDAGVIHSDAAVTSLSMQKHRDPENPRTVIPFSS
jgi:crossover junction endodeoxyribonuclease RusA